jgi:DNA-binding transcriptional regulator YhcF (GntR family)
MPWSFTSDAPIYLQAAQVIKLRILKGEYPPGEGIPSVRDLAQEAAVNPNTMQKALSLLESEGLLTTQRTAGRRVTEEQERLDAMRRSLALEYLRRCREQLEALGFSQEEIGAVMRKEEEEDE